jgi:DNA-directed RNA polymerase subunit M/transcription elongation factor TFIIS
MNVLKKSDSNLDLEHIAEKLEEGIFEHAFTRLDTVGFKDLEDIPVNEFTIMYEQNFVKVILNLERITKNQTGLDLLKTNDLESFVKLNRGVLYKEKWDSLYNIRTEVIEKKKGAHRCPRCKSWYTSYVEIQNRAADESSTVKVSCECGYKWKFH